MLPPARPVITCVVRVMFLERGRELTVTVPTCDVAGTGNGTADLPAGHRASSRPYQDHRPGLLSSECVIHSLFNVRPEFGRCVEERGITEVQPHAAQSGAETAVLDRVIEIRRRGSKDAPRKRRGEKDRATRVGVRDEDAGYSIAYPFAKRALSEAEVAGILVHDHGKEKIAEETGNICIQLRGAETLSVAAPAVPVATEAVAGGVFQRRRLKGIQTYTPRIIRPLSPFDEFFPRSQRLECLHVSYMEGRHHPEDVFR